MHIMAARQLTGTAEAMQSPNAELGLVFNMGGSGVANYCSILENGARYESRKLVGQNGKANSWSCGFRYPGMKVNGEDKMAA